MSPLAAMFDKQSPEVVCVTLRGTIDEGTELDDIFERIETDAVFDLGEVSRINSPGVLRWIAAISRFTAEHRAAIERVSYPMAVQAMCLSNMFADAEVRSCLAPYFCASCSAAHLVIVSASEVVANLGMPPQKVCPTCESLLDFDELDSYFAFLALP